MKILIASITCLLMLLACKQENEIPQSLKPNVLLIMTDDQGYGDIGRHGNNLIQTPHLDQLYDESIRFTNFHVATTCAPTRAGLMTGLHCNRVGAWHTINGRSFIASRFPTIADHLRSDGYTTGIFGKWHLGDNYPYRPQDRGFDEVLIHGGGGVGQTPDYWNNDYFDDTYFHNGVPKKFEGYCTDVWFAEAQKFITKASEQDDPFFCYITTNAPHSPYHVPQKYIDMYAAYDDIVNPNFYGMISNIDENIGRLLASMESAGSLDNTIVVFLTDNGSAAGSKIDENGHVIAGYNAGMRGKKVWEYEGGHRVPLFIKLPSKMGIQPKEYNELTTYTDLLPTLLDLTHTSRPTDQKTDGVSFYPLLVNQQQKSLEDRIVIVDTQREDLLEKYKRSCVMQGQWRLMNGSELYDLEADPGQKRDVLSDHPELVQTLKNAYEQWWSDFQEDAAQDNLIIIGNPAENPSLLTSHDYHAENRSPWHQRHVREGILENGHWKLEASSSGTYSLQLFRWPPPVNLKMADDVAEGSPVDGGQPYKPGRGFEAVGAKIKIQNQTHQVTALQNDQYFQFEVELEAGPADLQSWITLANEQEVGAYYVTIEKLQ